MECKSTTSIFSSGKKGTSCPWFTKSKDGCCFQDDLTFLSAIRMIEEHATIKDEKISTTEEVELFEEVKTWLGEPKKGGITLEFTEDKSKTENAFLLYEYVRKLKPAIMLDVLANRKLPVPLLHLPALPSFVAYTPTMDFDLGDDYENTGPFFEGPDRSSVDISTIADHFKEILEAPYNVYYDFYVPAIASTPLNLLLDETIKTILTMLKDMPTGMPPSTFVMFHFHRVEFGKNPNPSSEENVSDIVNEKNEKMYEMPDVKEYCTNLPQRFSDLRYESFGAAMTKINGTSFYVSHEDADYGIKFSIELASSFVEAA